MEHVIQGEAIAILLTTLIIQIQIKNGVLSFAMGNYSKRNLIKRKQNLKELERII